MSEKISLDSSDFGYDTCKMFPSGRKTGDHSFPLAKCIRQR